MSLHERISQYLEESGLAARHARVVPLTGDASDRHYFRVIPEDESSLVLALHAGPIDFATLPFARVAELLADVPLPVPDVLGHSDPLGILALQDLGDVTLQAHLGAATPARARSAVPRGRGAHRTAATARRGAAVGRVIRRTASRSTSRS